jgi:hypothetical protein
MRPVEDDVTWKIRARKLDEELRELCNEAVSDDRLDRLDHLAGVVFELRQDILDAHHVLSKGEEATKPYPWYAREWMRSKHWLLCAELLTREQSMKRIRTRLMGPGRDVDLMREREDEPRRLLDRFTGWLFSLTP